MYSPHAYGISRNASRLPRAIALAFSIFTAASLSASPAITLRVSAPAKAISPDLFGIFFEDINWSADGGLYAELIQNRSFEYQTVEQPTWNQLTGWEIISRDGGKGRLELETAEPLHPNNPHYAVFSVSEIGGGVGLANTGFDGIAIRAGESYHVSLFAKQAYNNNRWGKTSRTGTPPPLRVRLESKAGQILAEADLGSPTWTWGQLSTTFTAKASDDNARFVLVATAPGAVAIDVVSLFPEKTFHNRPNGLRADLAQVIADIHPKFIRFPGGCLAHGNGLNNIYRWKDTVGPIEQRREQPNIWGYHQTVGLGYFEYFQYCEDIGAKALPVLAAGVCCQNSDHTGGAGQRGIPLDQMPEYIQDVLDLIEYANGPATSTWGAKRAAAGHPAPFHLEYLGVGNEDEQTPEFRERFKLIYDAVKAKHPEITVVGTVGPAPSGADFDAGWKFARELKIPVVDEHYYQAPDWFLSNLKRYDTYDRAESHVYAGEYAAHDTGRKSTLRSALAEAAYMTGLERNGDVVRMSSYAPLLARVNHSQWTPDLIYFTATAVYPTINYSVQRLFGSNAGDTYWPGALSATEVGPNSKELAYSIVQDSRTGDVAVKLININAEPRSLHIELPAALKPTGAATKTVLAGDLDAVNVVGSTPSLLPETASLTVGQSFDYEAPAHSLTVIRFATK